MITASETLSKMHISATMSPALHPACAHLHSILTSAVTAASGNWGMHHFGQHQTGLLWIKYLPKRLQKKGLEELSAPSPAVCTVNNPGMQLSPTHTGAFNAGKYKAWFSACLGGLLRHR